MSKTCKLKSPGVLEPTTSQVASEEAGVAWRGNVPVSEGPGEELGVVRVSVLFWES